MYVEYKHFLRYDRQGEGWRSVVDTPPFPVANIPPRPKFIFNDQSNVVYDIPHRIDWISPVLPAPFDVRTLPQRSEYVYNDASASVYDIRKRIDWNIVSTPFSVATLPQKPEYIFNDLIQYNVYETRRRIDWLVTPPISLLPLRRYNTYDNIQVDFRYDKRRDRIFFSAPVVFDASLLPPDARRRYIVNSYESLYRIPKFDIGWINDVLPPIITPTGIVEYVITHRVRRRS